ncbi:hypothetical protein HYH02_005188 [Chlamydomonas schloesseri]|uniref:DUF1995 domain-containing protein n=1 Tax=Chlamydomonas schloesseri TaxID=2026947 RepID=A0A835WLX8_9CHLO|nr:hypothetical protein HYH02_005188 [Chlamydomonas schloesseri]|eukprot:KAG2449658.1 hypothetical protein HYH02_005188 [Chlamydomonas schloesseri]
MSGSLCRQRAGMQRAAIHNHRAVLAPVCRHRQRPALRTCATAEPLVATTTAAPAPPTTVTEAVRQARTALRQWREAAAAEAKSEAARRSGGQASTSSSSPSSPSSPSMSSGSAPPGGGSTGPRRLIVDLPLPAQRSGFLGRGASNPDLLMLLDEADFPGGEVQRFRVLRPLVEAWLEGYNPEFLGFLEDGADGVGLWSAGPDTSVIANVTSATVPSLLKLLDGGYGARASQPGHTVIAVNPTWTSASSVGQPWQFELRRRAAEVLDPAGWETLYSARMLRSSRGANGLLLRAWPHRWALYPAATPDARCLGECVLATPERPPNKLLIERLAEAKPGMDKKAKELGLDEPRWF